MIKVIERPSIVLKSIEFDINKTAEKSKVDEFSNDIGRSPYVEIGKLVIESSSTLLLELFNDQFLPRLHMIFKDTSGELIDPLFPLDDTIIKVFIQSNNNNLMPIRMDFKVLEIKPTKSKGGDSNDVIFDLTGILNVDNLYCSYYESFDDTSFNV